MPDDFLAPPFAAAFARYLSISARKTSCWRASNSSVMSLPSRTKRSLPVSGNSVDHRLVKWLRHRIQFDRELFSEPLLGELRVGLLGRLTEKMSAPQVGDLGRFEHLVDRAEFDEVEIRRHAAQVRRFQVFFRQASAPRDGF